MSFPNRRLLRGTHTKPRSPTATPVGTKRPTHRRHPLQVAPQRRTKTSRLSAKTSPLFAQNAPLFAPLPPRAMRHAPPHTRFSRSSFPAFTLHLSIYTTDYLKVTGEHSGHFLLHRGEGRRGEAFTPISLHLNNLRPKGEAVKAKIEKRRTRPARGKHPKNGFSDVLERGSHRGVPLTSDKRKQARRTDHFFIALAHPALPSSGESFNSPRPLDGFSPSGDKHQPLSLSFSLTDSGFSSVVPCRMNKKPPLEKSDGDGREKESGSLSTLPNRFDSCGVAAH